MNRQLFSAAKKCSGNCKYCFSQWKNYDVFPNFNVEKLNSECTIIYPNCDGDFFDENFGKLIEQLLRIKQKIIVSISTKNTISDKHIEKLLKLNEQLVCYGGFVKISYSFSCSNSINEIEPNTLNLDERIANIEKIRKHGITYCTIIKPILPFIPLEEYKIIIDKTLSFTKDFVLGDLYVDSTTTFFKKYIDGKYNVASKKVDWNNSEQEWLFVLSEKRSEIENYIKKNGGFTFESDKEFLETLVAGKGE